VSRFIQIVEVGPRDGLQNEKTTLTPAQRVEFIRRLESAGARRIETVSFVNPARVPQMAGAEEVCEALPADPRQSRIGLVLNMRGWERAVSTGCDEANVVVCASDAFGIRNQGAPTSDQMATLAAVAERRAATGGPRLSVTFSVAFGCHTRNTGLANAFAGVEAGVDVLDASCGGLGGCPFAPNATGNIGTEDLVYMLERAGFATGYDLPALMETAEWICALLGKTPTASVTRAGLFPRPA